jgi:hypothetical protein
MRWICRVFMRGAAGSLLQGTYVSRHSIGDAGMRPVRECSFAWTLVWWLWRPRGHLA